MSEVLSFNDLWPLLIGAAAVVHCCFLGVVLLKLSKKKSNQLLSATLLLLALRMVACLAGLIYPTIESIGIYLGAVAFAATGPLVHFYLIALWHPSFMWHKSQRLHFIPALLILLSTPFVNVYIIFSLYTLALLSLTIYVVANLFRLKKHKVQLATDQDRWKWTQQFLIGMMILLFLFHAQSFFFDATVYQGIIVGATFVLYAITILSIKRVKLFMAEPKKRDKKLQLLELGQQIEILIRKEHVFTNSSLTVATIAKELNVPAYLASQAINTHFERSFPEILNDLRIHKAEQLLTDASKSHYTVEAIAYESGFSTLSAFYTTFKKVNEKTPTEYRNGK
ncbi:MAG: helix-turn-helix domain-containing protein [Cytophagales bacterium]|nr:helix-turn-helix domain-containing protein [Cytophagales bacterium]